MKPYTLIPLTHPDVQPFRWEGRTPACLLIHGLTSTPWEVRPVALGLREAGFHAESLWLPGHGTKVEDLLNVTWRDWVDAVEKRFDEMKEEHGEVAILGTSLGGTLALWLGTTRPVATVISMGGAAWLRWAARLTRPMSWFRAFRVKSVGGSSIFDDEARLRHPSYPKTSYHAIAEMYDLTKKLKPRIKQISAPILIMHARQDRVIQPENAPWIYEQVNSKLKKLLWLEHSNHIITEDFDHPIVIREAVKWIKLIENENPLGVAGPRGLG